MSGSDVYHFRVGVEASALLFTFSSCIQTTFKALCLDDGRAPVKDTASLHNLMEESWLTKILNCYSDKNIELLFKVKSCSIVFSH